jgi:hypothetical protein
MVEIFTYRKRNISTSDVNFLRQLITDNPDESRRALSLRVCREWNWTQPNGVFKDGVCRGLMLKLHRRWQAKCKITVNFDIDQTTVISTVSPYNTIVTASPCLHYWCFAPNPKVFRGIRRAANNPHRTVLPDCYTKKLFHRWDNQT